MDPETEKIYKKIVNSLAVLAVCGDCRNFAVENIIISFKFRSSRNISSGTAPAAWKVKEKARSAKRESGQPKLFSAMMMRKSNN